MIPEQDSRVTQLVADVAELKQQMAENTAVTTQVRDILTSFRVAGAIAKWIASIGAGVAATYHGWTFFKGH
jgi:phage terminase Nu1 subunit (DNA packaging protein)